VTTSEWFPGEGRNAEEDTFLAEFRLLAEAGGLVDLRPEDTEVIALGAFRPLVLCARVPRLPVEPARPTLQVGFEWHSDDPPFLVGTWESWGYLLDQFEDIDISEVEPTPGQLSRRAFEWMASQLRRPVEQRTWQRHFGRQSMEWRLSDTDELITWGGSWLPWARKAPSRVERLR
jgi:hypothetical protein